MTDTGELLLAVIAIAMLVMAAVQIGAIVAGLRVARRVERLAADLETSVKPVIANLTTLTADASKAATLAATQVEKFDKLVADLTVRVNETMTTAQHFVAGPGREGMAIVAGIRAAISVFQGLRESARRRTAARAVTLEEDEESLFIG